MTTLLIGSTPPSRHSKEEWRQLVNEFHVSELSRQEFCEIRGVTLSRLEKWIVYFTRCRAISANCSWLYSWLYSLRIWPPPNGAIQPNHRHEDKQMSRLLRQHLLHRTVVELVVQNPMQQKQ